jgi:2-iminobutanoate/2-iminopropanoate deaminase
MKKQMIETDKAPDALGAYSQAVKVDNFIFVSGQLGIIPDTNKFVEGLVEAQTERAFENVKAILEEAGADFSNIVKVTVYLKDIEDFERVDYIYKQQFEKPYPARAVVEMARLPKEAEIMLDVIAMTSKAKK